MTVSEAIIQTWERANQNVEHINLGPWSELTVLTCNKLQTSYKQRNEMGTTNDVKHGLNICTDPVSDRLSLTIF